MEGFTAEQLLVIRDYFGDPDYPRPHGEVMATQLLAAMIASGRYGAEQYADLAEIAVELTGLLVNRFDDLKSHLRGVRDNNNSKPPASENDRNSDSDSEAYDPIPF